MTEVTADDYDTVLDLNLRAAFFVAQGCARAMLREGITGSLIHMGSQMGHVGGPNRALYCASKWGLEGMSKAFALDLASAGIRSNTIAPTFIETPLTRPFFEDEAFRASVLAKIKLGRARHGRGPDGRGAVPRCRRVGTYDRDQPGRGRRLDSRLELGVELHGRSARAVLHAARPGRTLARTGPRPPGARLRSRTAAGRRDRACGRRVRSKPGDADLLERAHAHNGWVERNSPSAVERDAQI